MSVTDIDAERVFRCAFRLAQVAEGVRTSADRTARCYPDDWRGEAGIAYQRRLDETAARVRRLSAAYDVASEALMPYARALLDAQVMWRRSESLLSDADAAGPGPGASIRWAAYRLQAEAAELERRAAVTCVATLDEEAGRATGAGSWRKVDRFLGDVSGAVVGTVAGAASLANTGWHALPGVGDRHSRHEARHDLAGAGKDAFVSIWNLPVDVREAVEDGRPGVAVADVLSVVGPGKLSKLDLEMLRVEALADVALRDADVAARVAATVPRSVTARELTGNGFDPLNEEARGGHTLREHVARPAAYLHYRNGAGLEVASSFVDEWSADRLVNAVLEFHPDEIASLYSESGPKKVVLHATFDEVTGYYTVPSSAATFPAHGVSVVVVLREGEPHVRTAFPTR